MTTVANFYNNKSRHIFVKFYSCFKLLYHLCFSFIVFFSGHHQPCAQRNGECSHFCFPVAVTHTVSNPQLNSHCGCPFGMKLDINMRNCVPNPEENLKFGCSENTFECSNKQCVPMFLRCNGQNDCIDNSDELNCTSGGYCYPFKILQSLYREKCLCVATFT